MTRIPLNEKAGLRTSIAYLSLGDEISDHTETYEFGIAYSYLWYVKKRRRRGLYYNYIHAGLSMLWITNYHYLPQDLLPVNLLKPEGETLPAFALPIGVDIEGYPFKSSPRWLIGFYGLFSVTSTDLLDGSFAWGSMSVDLYYTFGFYSGIDVTLRPPELKRGRKPRVSDVRRCPIQ